MKKFTECFSFLKSKGFWAFSLTEVIVSLIVVATITATMAPVVTKKLSSKAVTVGSNKGGATEFRTDCAKWDGCAFCTSEKCSLCPRVCGSDEFVNVADCTCKKCDTKFPGCLSCNEAECKQCFSGHGYSSSKTCKICSAGTYSDGTFECKPAEAGYFVDGEGKSTQTKCPKGTAQSQTGQSECITCTAGSYSNTTGLTECKTCEEDFKCTGGENRTQCAANEGAVAGSSTCSACPTSCADCKIPSTCIKCNSGNYVSAGTCNSCTAGYSCNGTTQTKCTAGTYSDSAGTEKCTDCPKGYYCTGGKNKTSCGTGKYLDTTKGKAASDCKTCASKTANCTACNATTGVCTGCASGYKISNGKCIANFCSEEDPNFMPITTAEGAKLCATRYNIGDSDIVTLPSSYSGTCWTGKKTSKNCDTKYGTYSGCNRTVCTWEAANSICSKVKYNNKTWRLPTKAEMSNWATYSIGKDTNSLWLCDWGSGQNSTRCYEGAGLCKESYTKGCYPHIVWSGTSKSSNAKSNKYDYALAGGTWLVGEAAWNDAFSVRCVTEM